MSNHPPENDPLGLFTDDEPDIEPEPLSPEHIALLEDLKAYDNPAAYNDPDNPHIYKLRIVTPALEHFPAILNIELDGADLFAVLRECFFAMLRNNSPNAEKDLVEEYGAEDWNETRSIISQEADYKTAEAECYWFFVRHFPSLMVRVYEVFLTMTVMSIFKTSVFSTKEQQNMEPAIKRTLELGIRQLQNEIKRMLRTRSSGRPTKIEEGSLPEIVQRVLDIAQAVMGDKRGKSAVPGLKGIANILDLSEDALGHQLRRAGFPWTMIRTHLESQT